MDRAEAPRCRRGPFRFWDGAGSTTRLLFLNRRDSLPQEGGGSRAGRAATRIGRGRLPILIGGALALIASLYPPLNSAGDGWPLFASFLDERFDASTRVPEYTIDQSMLTLEWLIIAVAVALLLIADRARCSAGSR